VSPALETVGTDRLKRIEERLDRIEQILGRTEKAIVPFLENPSKLLARLLGGK